MRVADEDRQLSARELEQLIPARHRDTLRWDSEPSSANANLEAIDPDKLERFVENAGLSWSSPADALEKLGVQKRGQLLNAATLFFAKTSVMQLRCAVFGGTTSAAIIDRHDFEGDIKGNVSKRRNPLVAELLRRVHMVEAWGRGVPLILEKEPGVQFREIAKLFITHFDRPSFGESVDKAVVTTQEKIIACLKAGPTLTRKLLAQRVGLSEDGVKYHLNKLKAAGKIRHVGPTKAGRREVTDGRLDAPDSRGVGGGHE